MLFFFYGYYYQQIKLKYLNQQQQQVFNHINKFCLFGNYGDGTVTLNLASKIKIWHSKLNLNIKRKHWH